MEINKTIKDNVCSIALEGRLDTVSAPDLETIFNEISESDVKELQLDFKGLDYISSAGLRVLLRGQRMMSEKGGMEQIMKNMGGAFGGGMPGKEKP